MSSSNRPNRPQTTMACFTRSSGGGALCATSRRAALRRLPRAAPPDATSGTAEGAFARSALPLPFWIESPSVDPVCSLASGRDSCGRGPRERRVQSSMRGAAGNCTKATRFVRNGSSDRTAQEFQRLRQAPPLRPVVRPSKSALSRCRMDERTRTPIPTHRSRRTRIYPCSSRIARLWSGAPYSRDFTRAS